MRVGLCRGQHIRILIVVSIAFAATISGRSALALCTAEQTAFVERPNVRAAAGVLTKNIIRDLPVDVTTGCTRAPERHSTAHIRGPDYCGHIEIGWTHDRQGPGGTDRWLGFWETGKCSGDKKRTIVTGIGTFAVNEGGSHAWKCYRQVGTRTWALFVDGALKATKTVTFDGGRPMGETGRTGTETSAYDHHSGLKYRDSGGTWRSWTAQRLVNNDIGGYFYQPDPSKLDDYQIHS
jgi:hypothetical protein